MIIKNDFMNWKYFVLSLIVVLVFSCGPKDEDYEFVQVATPQLMSKSAFRSAVKVDAPREIENVGKIYAYKDLIFVGDDGKGIHVIDNSNPTAPQSIKFIEIPRNEDISVKNDFCTGCFDHLIRINIMIRISMGNKDVCDIIPFIFRNK